MLLFNYKTVVKCLNYNLVVKTHLFYLETKYTLSNMQAVQLC
jgi:hypothetical protein